MIFVPLHCEDEFERPPLATAGLVLANFLVALIFGCVNAWWPLFRTSNPELLESLLLQYGEFAPHTWITSAFVHGNVGHLIGNMIFLFAIGMIVEGLLGWRKYLCVYFGIALASGDVHRAGRLARRWHITCLSVLESTPVASSS